MSNSGQKIVELSSQAWVCSLCGASKKGVTATAKFVIFAACKAPRSESGFWR